MNRTFIQKKGWNSRSFILYADRIQVERKDLRRHVKFEIPLDRLGFEIYYQNDNTAPGKIMLVVTVLVSVTCFICAFYMKQAAGILGMFGVMFGFLSFANFLKPNEDDIFLSGSEKTLAFFLDKPNEEAVLDFINQIQMNVKALLKVQYTTFNKYTDEEDYYQRIYWLLTKGIITEKEFDRYETEFRHNRLM